MSSGKLDIELGDCGGHFAVNWGCYECLGCKLGERVADG